MLSEKNSPRAARKIIRKVDERPMTIRKEIQEDLKVVRTSITNRTIRNELRKNDLCFVVLERHLCCLWVKFYRNYLGKSDNFWNSILWSDETQIWLFGKIRRVLFRGKTACLCSQEYHTHSEVRRRYSIIVWGSFSSIGTWALHVIDGIMNGPKYHDIIQEHSSSYVQ